MFVDNDEMDGEDQDETLRQNTSLVGPIVRSEALPSRLLRSDPFKRFGGTLLVGPVRRHEALPLGPLRSDPRPQSYVYPVHQNSLNSELFEKHQEKIKEPRMGNQNSPPASLPRFLFDARDQRHTRPIIIPDLFVNRRLRNSSGNLSNVPRKHINLAILNVSISDVINHFYNEMLLPFLLEKYLDPRVPGLKFQNELLDDFEKKVIYLSYVQDNDKIKFFVLNIIDRFRYVLKNDNIHLNVIDDIIKEIKSYNWKIMEFMRDLEERETILPIDLSMEMIDGLVKSFLSQESRRDIKDRYMSVMTQNSKLYTRPTFCC